jgi:hypothetical protein
MLPYYSDATMWGPQGDPNKERNRLKPGDRLADGRIYMGNDPEALLLTELERVSLELRPLEEQRNQLLRKLHELNPEKYGVVVEGVEVEVGAPTAELTDLPIVETVAPAAKPAEPSPTEETETGSIPAVKLESTAAGKPSRKAKGG